MEEYLNSYKKEDTITDATKELIKQFYDEQNILDTMEKSVNILVNTIKEKDMTNSKKAKRFQFWINVVLILITLSIILPFVLVFISSLNTIIIHTAVC